MGWPEIADEIRERSDSAPQRYMFSVVKVHFGNSKFTLFSVLTVFELSVWFVSASLVAFVDCAPALLYTFTYIIYTYDKDALC